MERKRREVKRLPHHEQDNLCTTRPAYRQGRQLTAVKVYTVNDESQHIVVSGVPALGLQDDLRKLLRRFGDVKSLVYIPNYAIDQFVEAYHVHYARIQSARFAKRQSDGRAFFGGVLHVCYAPEMETVSETRSKLIQRRHDVAKRCVVESSGGQDSIPSGSRAYSIRLNSTDYNVRNDPQSTCIWNGRATRQDPRLAVPARELEEVDSIATYGPQPLTSDWRDVGVREVIVQQFSLKQRSAVLPSASKKFHISIKHSSSIHFQTPHDRQTVDFESSNKPATDNETFKSSVLRFVPSQVKQGQKRIVFHQKSSSGSDSTIGNKSLDITVKSVRERIRAVGVPNVKLLLEKKIKIT